MKQPIREHYIDSSKQNHRTNTWQSQKSIPNMEHILVQYKQRWKDGARNAWGDEPKT